VKFLPDIGLWKRGLTGETMTRRKRRNYSGGFKAKVAMAAIKGDRTLSELAQAFDVHANQITQWRTELLDGAAGVFDDRAQRLLIRLSSLNLAETWRKLPFCSVLVHARRPSSVLLSD
jgi:Transposase